MVLRERTNINSKTYFSYIFFFIHIFFLIYTKGLKIRRESTVVNFFKSKNHCLLEALPQVKKKEGKKKTH